MQNEEMQEVLVGNDTMSIKLHLHQMEDIESRLREVSYNLFIFLFLFFSYIIFSLYTPILI